jgi:hypothetical protein
MNEVKEGTSDSHIQSYLDKLVTLKERKLLKEILEQEMLLTFIRANMERINEFPLLETEQNGLIKLLSFRAQDHPCQQHVKAWLNDFLNSLNHYSKPLVSNDAAELERTKDELLRAEKILIQCIQGVVYAISLAKDNLGAAVVGAFGADAVEDLQTITKTVEPDESFWRAVIDRFIRQRIDDGFAEVIKEKKYTLSKDESLVVLRFNLDHIIHPHGGALVEVEPTRIQKALEAVSTTPEGRAILSCLKELLLRQKHESVLSGLSPELTELALRIVCTDTTAKKLCKMREERKNASPAPRQAEDTAQPEGPSSLESELFMEQQLLAMTVGTGMATDIFRADLPRAAKELSGQTLKTFEESIGNLERQRMPTALLLLMEIYFHAYLREKAEDDAGKLLLRTSRTKRAPRQSVLALADKGLNRIRQKKFFRDDPSDPDNLLFTAKNAAELQQMFSLFQLEQELVRELLNLWRQSLPKVEVLAAVNLKQLAKVTTNLPQRVASILARFGIAVR